jgi:hypothetical protein
LFCFCAREEEEEEEEVSSRVFDDCDSSDPFIWLFSLGESGALHRVHAAVFRVFSLW